MVPVGIGRGGGVGELRQDTAELLVRSIEGGEGRRRGFDGEVELAGVRAERRRCSGAWKRGKGERALGLACWGTCSAHAREKSVSGVLQRASHDGGEVAAGGRFCSRGTERRAPARGKRAVETVGRNEWVPAQAGGGLEGGPERRAALPSGGEEQSRQAGRRWKNLD